MEEETNNNPSNLKLIDKGFIQIPNVVLNAVLFNNLLKRDFAVVLLIFRLTYGCHCKWAALRQCDLQVIDISEQHAKAVLTRLLQKNIIIKNNKTEEVRVNEEFLISKAAKSGSYKFEKLRELVGTQLWPATLDGKVVFTKKRSNSFPREKVTTSRNGNFIHFPKREVSASNTDDFATPKDILNKSNGVYPIY